ncbi:MAG: FkbM family methyltransferase [Bryobacteraceae bacterium]|jgi:FkbM family methyltransferase
MLLKRAASYLPWPIREALRAYKYRFEFATGRFRSGEPEFDELPSLVQPGDWVLDIGANVGQYTLRLSDLAGNDGRVIAFEPIIETAELLISMSRRSSYRNITVLNAAVSDRAGILSFRVPTSADGLPNYFQARVSGEGDRLVPCFAIDDLHLPRRIALVKIDVEQHEVSVLRGMRNLIARDRPTLIIEAHEGVYREFLMEHGYEMRPRAIGSANLVFRSPRRV